MAKRRRKRRPRAKFDIKMRQKLLVLFAAIVAVLVFLIGKLIYINYTSGEKYTKKVLSLQSYDSSTLAFQRGDIVDTNGTVLATSVAVYNVILDCSVVNSDEDYIDPTVEALLKCFDDLDEETIRGYITDSPDSKYIVLEKKLPYADVEELADMLSATDDDGNLLYPKVKGVWLETEYQRSYPYDSLASSVIGFTASGNVGQGGLEQYYNETLNGVNGRQYGYLNSDSSFEKTVIAPEDGDNIITTIDVNIQSVVEDKIKEFCSAYENNDRTGDGAENVAVVVMNPNNGEVLAMADYPTFDLNNPKDLTGFFEQDEIDQMTDDESLEFLYGLWQNYCVTATYEPGSVQKPFTVACGLETGTLTEDMTFMCDGGETIAGNKIRCVNRNGHGLETLEGALMDSCNDSLMQMSYKIGATNFLNYQSIFGFGYKTGIDLPGEANTSTLVYNEDNITTIDLACNSFGQNYNCTMVQMISAFSSLINGGTYYQPHMVKKITDSDGNTISTINSMAVRQTISESTSDTIKGYLYNVVSEGTGGTAKVDGYSMGGKTGTAQKYDEETHLRKTGSYLVSFIGFAPYDDPQVAIYCIVDEPNVKDEAHSTYAQNIVREILEEILPYMNIYPDEELTGRNANLDAAGNSTTDGTAQEIQDEKPVEDTDEDADEDTDEDAADDSDAVADTDDSDTGDDTDTDDAADESDNTDANTDDAG